MHDRSPPPSEKGSRIVSENKKPSSPAQLFPPARLVRSAIWQQEQRALAKLRGVLPQYTPEELEKLRAMLKTPELPADGGVPPQLLELLREERKRRAEEEAAEETAEQAAGQSVEQAAERPPEQLLEQQPEPRQQPPPEPPSVGQQQVLKKPKLNARLEIPHLGEALEALAKIYSDPRKKVTASDIRFVIQDLAKKKVVIRQKPPDDQRQTIRRRIKEDRERRMAASESPS
jgi:hypothetical protein